jgi:hypothetical protein
MKNRSLKISSKTSTTVAASQTNQSAHRGGSAPPGDLGSKRSVGNGHKLVKRCRRGCRRGDLNPHGLAPTSTSSCRAMSTPYRPVAFRLLTCVVGVATRPSGDAPCTPCHRVGLQKWLQIVCGPLETAHWRTAGASTKRPGNVTAFVDIVMCGEVAESGRAAYCPTPIVVLNGTPTVPISTGPRPISLAHSTWTCSAATTAGSMTISISAWWCL